MNLAHSIKNPRRSIVYIVDREAFKACYGNSQETCFSFKPTGPLQVLATSKTDIHEHLVPLYMLTVELNLKRILELGTRDGDSTVALLMPAKKIHGTVRSIDINPCENARKRVKAAGLDALWQFKMIDDRTFEPDSEIDHLFIDTSHSYEQTLSELKRFEPYVSRGGVISMHDAVSSPGVPRAVDDFVSSRGDLSLHILLNNNGLALIFKH